MYKSNQERTITAVLAAHIALQSSHQFSKIIILKSPPLQKDLFAVLLFYLYWNTLSLQVNQLHCHLHKLRTQAIPSGPYAWALAYSSWHSLQIHRCISIFLNNIYQYYCFFNRHEPSWSTCLPVGSLSVDSSYSCFGAIGDNPDWVRVVIVNRLQYWSLAC